MDIPRSFSYIKSRRVIFTFLWFSSKLLRGLIKIDYLSLPNPHNNMEEDHEKRGQYPIWNLIHKKRRRFRNAGTISGFSLILESIGRFQRFRLTTLVLDNLVTLIVAVFSDYLRLLSVCGLIRTLVKIISTHFSCIFHIYFFSLSYFRDTNLFYLKIENARKYNKYEYIYYQMVKY